jgi:arylformamidase
MGKIIDVTVPLSAGLARYPGDPPFELVATSRMSEGAVCNSSRLSMSSHCGTHVDAPRHFVADGATVDAIPLEILVGKARVVDLQAAERIERADLETLDLRDDIRLLIRTRMSGQMRSRVLHEDSVCLSADAARYVVQVGIKLVGIDYLSVDRIAHEGFPAHRELLGAGVIVLEGLDLSDVAPGEYELICLPLPLAGADGAPARVILRTRL